jgi:hypothetical protein
MSNWRRRQTMPVTATNYDPRGGNNRGIVVRCPNLVGPHLVYFDLNSAKPCEMPSNCSLKQGGKGQGCTASYHR